MSQIFQTLFIIFNLFQWNHNLRKSDIFRNTYNVFTKVKVFLQTSIPSNYIVLYCKVDQAIFVSQQFRAVFITVLMYLFCVACETSLTKMLSIQVLIYYFVGISFVITHKNVAFPWTYVFKDNLWLRKRMKLVRGLLQTSVLNHFIKLNFKGDQDILVILKCYVALITDPL